MDLNEKLNAIEEIKQLKARYFRFVDTFDLEGWMTVFTEDVVCEYDRGIRRNATSEIRKDRYEGTAMLRGYWENNPGRLRSVHHGHMPEIQILSETEAKGVWAMEDIVEYAEMNFHGHGHYHETYKKVNGEWKIATLYLTRLRLHQQRLNQMSF